MNNAELTEELIKFHTENIVIIGKLAEHFSMHGEEAILFFMCLENKPIFAGDFKEKTGLTSGRIATILKQLEAKKYIIRCQNENDKRKILVKLTEEGRTVIEAELKNMTEMHKNLLKYLGENDSAELIRIMKRVLNYVSDNEKDFM